MSSPAHPGASNDPLASEGPSHAEPPRQEQATHSWGGAAVTFGCLVLTGVVGGLLWLWLWEPQEYLVVDGVTSLDEVGVSQAFTSDAWYAVIAFPLALAAGMIRRRFSARSGLLDLAAAVAGSIAAAFTMQLTGLWLGPDYLEPAAIAQLPDLTAVESPLALDSSWSLEGIGAYLYVVMLAWPLGVMAGWVAELVAPSLEPPAERLRHDGEQPSEQPWEAYAVTPDDPREHPVTSEPASRPTDPSSQRPRGGPPAPPG